MTEADFSRCKIAIVDSDNLFCQQLQSCLRDAGFLVEYERNAHTGLKKIKSWKPHIVISDYVVHGMDYFDFAQQVESLPFKAQMVVVSSHYLDGPLLSQLSNISRVALTVQKPVKPQDLLNKVIDLFPLIDFSEPVEIVEPVDTESDYSLNDKDLQQEIARLQFEAKELPRFVASMKALTSLAHQQPHKSQYLREALEQSKNTIEQVRRQRLPHLEAPLEKVTKLLNEILDKGSLPSLKAWDLVQDELIMLSEPKNRIGTSTLPDFDSESTEELESASNFPDLVAPSFERSLGLRSRQAITTPTPGQTFLLVGNDPSEELLNLGSQHGVSIICRDNLERAKEACQSETFDLVLLLLPPTLSGERARETVISFHECLREVEKHAETPLVVLSEVESMHTRIVTAHLNNSYWLGWSDLRKDDTAFLRVKAIASQSGIRPSVLLVDSDISDSEELLRELSRRCSRIETLREADNIFKVIQERKPDVVLVSERVGDLSGVELCRAISTCPSFCSVTIILESITIDAGTLKGAFRAGADGIVCKSDSKSSRAEVILKIWRRCFASRNFGDSLNDSPLEVSEDIRASLDRDLKRSIEDQLPLTVCLIDLSSSELSCNAFEKEWKSRLSESHSNETSVHLLSPTRLFISVVGLRKSKANTLLQQMLQEYNQTVNEPASPAFMFRCRSYPENALSLAELLGSF